MKNSFHKEYKLYKSYEQDYNSKENKKEAFNLISNLKEKFNNRKSTLSDEVQSEIDSLESWLKLASEEGSGSGTFIYYIHDMDLMINKLGLKLHQVSIYYELKKLKELYGERVASFIKDVKGKDKVMPYLRMLNSVIDAGEKYLESLINFNALSEIEDKIVSEGYPDSISRSKFWDERVPISNAEKEKILNQLDNSEKTKHKNKLEADDWNIKPHVEVIDDMFKEMKEKTKVAVAFKELKEILLEKELDPREYGLKDDAHSFNRASNKRIEKLNRNKSSRD